MRTDLFSILFSIFLRIAIFILSASCRINTSSTSQAKMKRNGFQCICSRSSCFYPTCLLVLFLPLFLFFFAPPLSSPSLQIQLFSLVHSFFCCLSCSRAHNSPIRLHTQQIHFLYRKLFIFIKNAFHRHLLQLLLCKNNSGNVYICHLHHLRNVWFHAA